VRCQAEQPMLMAPITRLHQAKYQIAARISKSSTPPRPLNDGRIVQRKRADTSPSQPWTDQLFENIVVD